MEKKKDIAGNAHGLDEGIHGHRSVHQELPSLLLRP